MTTDFVCSEAQAPETPFEEHKFRVSYQCQQCGHEWKSRWLKAVPKKDPPCPNPSCAEVTRLRQQEAEHKRLLVMLEEGRAPAHIGQSNVVKAVDQTADIVMKDYKLTDLRDGIRPGESMAPKLPPQQQALADGVFGGSGDMKVRDPTTGQTASIQASALTRLGRRAIGGAFRNMAVAPNAVIPESVRNRAPLTVVRTEKAR